MSHKMFRICVYIICDLFLGPERVQVSGVFSKLGVAGTLIGVGMMLSLLAVTKSKQTPRPELLKLRGVKPEALTPK